MYILKIFVVSHIVEINESKIGKSTYISIVYFYNQFTLCMNFIYIVKYYKGRVEDTLVESPDGGNRLKREPNAKHATVALVDVRTTSRLFPLMAMFTVEFHIYKG